LFLSLGCGLRPAGLGSRASGTVLGAVNASQSRPATVVIKPEEPGTDADADADTGRDPSETSSPAQANGRKSSIAMEVDANYQHSR